MLPCSRKMRMCSGRHTLNSIFKACNKAEQRSVTWKIINPELANVFIAKVNVCVLDNNISICIEEIILVRFAVSITSNPLIFKKLICVSLQNLKIARSNISKLVFCV